ncbi:ornithine decarboxylase 1 [Papilio machaon]|uniref:ornithine decarboxylase 1 n=1 Tax=Papilio machaon TaxID=76193 RepID=UPI001E663F1B|nr:ornithine decarboxylase 1 [Papilio machaon]
MKVIEDEQRVRVMEGPWTPEAVIKEIVEEGGHDEPFYVMDLGEVVARYHHWKELMPRVEPFYAVKCNDDKLLVSTLAALGAGFDCASKAEIEMVTGLGVRPERIIFANPAKLASHIRYSSSVGVDLMTFDSETELVKIKQHMPHAQLVVRIRCDAAAARCPLGIKFGCDPVTEAPRLLKLAAVFGLRVVGVSFHVGSGAEENGVYARAIQYCRALFTLGAAAGHTMHLLDLGGGFPGHTGSSIRETAQVINAALDANFSGCEVRVIAEPGRYFACAAYTLATMIYAKREVPAKEDDVEETHTMYFMNDGVYGSFNCLLYDHQEVTPVPLNTVEGTPHSSSFWGPTCDGLDCVVPRMRIPALPLGAWLVFRDMGAYTIPVASSFNGFPVPKVRAVVDRRLWSVLKELWPLTENHFVVAPPAPVAPLAPVAPPPEPHRAVFVECALK